MAYVPKHRRLKIRWKVAAPLLILLMLCVYMLVSVLHSVVSPEPKRFTICDFSNDKTVERLSKKYQSTYKMSDYLYYGETLNLMQNPYNPEVADPLSGKTVQFNNICTGEKFPFVFENAVDRQVALDELTVGYYEIFVIDDLQPKRAVYATPLKDTDFTTVKRKDKVNQISLIADQNLLKKDYKKFLDQNYLFLEVKETDPKDKQVDVLLDPSGYNKDFTYTVDKGVEANGLVEYEENYKAAVELKKALEKYGLRVMITRDKMNQALNTYGKEGRLGKAYASKARYMFHIGQSESTYDSVKGMEIYYSNHASATFANALLYDLKKNTQLTGNVAYATDLDNAGVMSADLVEGVDGRKIYDGDMYIRESGGRATIAGSYSENAAKQNASFAKDNKQGIQTLSIYYSYFTNKQDAAYWKSDRAKIMNATANSIARMLHVEKTK